MHDPDISISLEGLRIYEDDELVFDGSDPSTYTVCEIATDIATALAAGADMEDQ